MTESSLSKVDELLSLYKDATVRVVKNVYHPYTMNENAVESIISLENRARQSKRLLKRRENIQKVEPCKKEVINDPDELPVKEECLVVNNEEVIPFLVVNVGKKHSYVEEDLLEIHTRVIPVNPLREEGINNADNGLNEMSIRKSYKSTRNKPRLIINRLPRENELSVKALKRKKVRSNLSVNITGKVKNSNIPKTHRSTRLLQNIKTNIGTITKPIKDNTTSIKVQQINSKTKSTTEERTRTQSFKDRVVSSEAHKAFSCIKCDKSFTTASKLKAHNISHTGVKSYVCDRCPSRYGLKSHLRRHLLTHKKNTKKFKCSDCQKSFHQKYYLQVHMRVHSGAKPYTCDECTKSFSQKSHLNTHAKTHKQREFSCDLCSKSFTLFHHISRHVNSVHK